MGNKIRIRMLHLARALRRCNHTTQTIVVKLVGGGASRASAKDGAHGDDMVFFGNILMNRVVREAGKRKIVRRRIRTSTSSADESLRMRSKDVGGLFASQHRMVRISWTPVFFVPLCLDELASFVSTSHFDLPKPRRRRAMACAHHLLRLAFAAIRRAPERPLVARADRIQRIPELGRDAGIRRILHHAHALAVLDLPTDLAAELKVVSTYRRSTRSGWSASGCHDRSRRSVAPGSAASRRAAG